MVFDYLNSCSSYRVYGTYYESFQTSLTKNHNESLYKVGIGSYDDFLGLGTVLEEINADIVINCIGVIKQSINSESASSYQYYAVLLNAALPAYLSKHLQEKKINSRVIQIATDCVYDGLRGWYDEFDPPSACDIYGQTKSLGEYVANNFLNIRCSIIGPELSRHKSLIDWFLYNTEAVVSGYQNHLWNGVTTLQFAKLMEEIIDKGFESFRSINHILHYAPNTTVSKYELLKIVSDLFPQGKSVQPVYSNQSVNRTIISRHLEFEVAPMREAVESLFHYIAKSDTYCEHVTRQGMFK